MQTRVTDQFNVVDDDGNLDVATEYTDMINTGDLGGPSNIDGNKSYRLPSGEALNRVDAVTFQAVRSGKTWHRQST